MEKNADHNQPIFNRQNVSSTNQNPFNISEYYQHKRTAVIEYNGEEFKYDISDRCQFRSLKKMIQASLKIRRSLINFYKLNGEELRDCDDIRLSETFPNEKIFYLKIKLSPKEAEINSSRRKIYLDNYCNLHARKYLGMYCFTCKKSFCIFCLEENLHRGHNYLEKYDYLQNSKFLVDESFKSISNTINSTDFTLKEKCDNLLSKNDDYFDSVIEMIKSLKFKTRSFISNYAENSKASLNNLKTNLELIKDTCTESLEELKEKLIMENIICCEETFIEFDNKYRSLKEEEKRIEADKANYEDLLNYFKTLSNSVNSLYEDMKSYVSKKDQDFNDVLDSRSIENKLVNQISQLQICNIQSKILENVKEGYFKNPNREKSYFNKTKNDLSNMSNLTNSNFTDSYVEVKNPEITDNINTILENKNVNISNFNTYENTNTINDLNNRRSNLNNNFPSIPNQDQQFFTKQALFTNIESENNSNNNNNNPNRYKENIGTSNILRSDNNIFSNFNTISPIAGRKDRTTNNNTNLLNNGDPNRTVHEDHKNNFNSNDDDNSWKMAYNTANRNNNRISYDSILDKNKNTALTLPKIKYDSPIDNVAIPTFNINIDNKPDYMDNLPNNKIDICSKLDNNKLEIDLNIKYPSLETRENKQLSNLETRNVEPDNRIFSNIPIIFEKEASSVTNKNEPKPDKMDIVSNFEDKNTLEKKEESKSEEFMTMIENPQNLKKTTACNFYENVTKISNDLQLGKSKTEATNEISNPSTSNDNTKSKKEDQKCSCIDDLFDTSLKYHIFVAPIPSTNQIKIYHENMKQKQENKLKNLQPIEKEDGNEDEIFSEICELAVDFPSLNILKNRSSKNNKSNNSSSNDLNKEKALTSYFFNNSAFVNKVSENDLFRILTLYVSGGSDPRNDCDSSRFLLLEFKEKKIHSLPDMLEARSYHSMIEYDNLFLFVVGGKEKNTCEKFDLNKKEWKKMPNLKLGERRNPGLIVYKEFLYAFFGWNKTGCLDSIERIGLRSSKAQWEFLSFKNGEKINLGMWGFAIFPNKIKPSEIFILGGRNESETRDSILKFDFNDFSFSSTKVNLAKRSFFKESQLVKLSQDYYGHFDNEQLDDIVRLN